MPAAEHGAGAGAPTRPAGRRGLLAAAGARAAGASAGVAGIGSLAVAARGRGLSAVRPSALRWPLAVAALLAGALGLRLWGVAHGMPFAYNADENAHFLPKAVELLGHGWDPQYFVNPPAYTYLLRLALALRFGGGDAARQALATDPAQAFVLARVVSALLGTLAVGLLYVAGARLVDRRVGLLAAGLLAVAFLPVFYAHLALNDVPTLAPVALALVGVGGIVRRGRRVDFVVAGLGLGLACATKYTGGIALLAIVAAGLGRGRRGLTGLLIAGGVSLVAFVAVNPYALLDFAAFREGMAHQSAAADEVGGKLGLERESGIRYYLWTLTWGLGWVPALAALGGAVALAVRRSRLFWVLVPGPLAFLGFMGLQGRYFGRWILPIFPLLCLLAAVGAILAVDRLAARRPALRPTLIAVAVVALCAQGVVSSVHAGLVLSRADTRNLTRAWLVAHVPPTTKMVVEPGVVPNGWVRDVGHDSLLTGTGARWVKFHTSRSQINNDGTIISKGPGRIVNVEDYERTTRPELVDEYERGGYCYVVTGSTQAGRAFAARDEVPQAIRYYRRLRSRSEVVFRATPYRPGARGVPFNFDWSFDFEPLAYARPGPVVTVYRLTTGGCAGGVR